MTPLASLRLSAPDAADLRWLLLRDFEGDLGVLRSNLGPTIARLELRTCSRPPNPASWHTIPVHDPPAWRDLDVSDAVLHAASRLRRLARRWASIPDTHREALQAVYGATRRVLPEWGDLGPLVLVSGLARASYDHARDSRPFEAWLARLPVRPAAAPLASRIRIDAERRLVSACRSWEDSRRPRAA